MIIIYISDKNNTPITQIDYGIRDFEVKQRLNEISESSFSLLNSHIDATYNNFKEGNKIKICLSKDNEERLFLEGIIKKVSCNKEVTKVLVYDHLYLLKRQIITSEKTYNTSLKNILSDLIEEKNLDLILECDINENISKTFNAGTNILDILQELASDTYEFKISDKTLIFKANIGEDRTQIGENYREFIFNYKNPRENNISDIKLEYDLDNLANSVFAKSGDEQVFLENKESQDEFGILQEVLNTSGNLQSEAQNYLDEHKISQREYEITPLVSDFFFCNLADKIKVFVDLGNDITYFDGSLKVTEKKYKLAEKTQITFKLAKTKVNSSDIIETLKNLKTSVKKLQNNS